MKYLLCLILLVFSSFKPATLTENEVYCYIVKVGIKHPEIVLKQAIYETGHFKSYNSRVKNNIFGFRRTATYITYDSWQACVDYYKKWQDKHYKDSTQDYYAFLQKINYVGNSRFNYSGEVRKIKIRDSLKCN